MMIAVAVACMGAAGTGARGTAAHLSNAVRIGEGGGASPVVQPGITVLLHDSIDLIAGKRLGLLTNQTGIDEHGTSDIDLLYRLSSAVNDDRSSSPTPPKLVALFSPEHGIRGTEDHTNLANGRDARTGLPVFSLYGATTLAPPDSALDQLDALIIDLQDLGARPWTFVASMVYAMRSAAAHHLPVIVLDRPNPITGTHAEGPLLDSTIAYAGSNAPPPGRPATPTSLYPIPMRHGLTMGELARFYDHALQLGADLHVIPMRGWRRAMWFDETGLPWVKPSPNMPSLASATLYPGVVILESTNVSVGRGTPIAFQQFGAPWLDARRVVALLRSRHLPGLRFAVERFTPNHPTDEKYGGRTVPGVRILITDRDRIETSRLGATLFWAIARANGDSLRVRARSFDQLFGVPAAREALLRDADPDSIVEAGSAATQRFEAEARAYLLYR